MLAAVDRAEYYPLVEIATRRDQQHLLTGLWRMPGPVKPCTQRCKGQPAGGDGTGLHPHTGTGRVERHHLAHQRHITDAPLRLGHVLVQVALAHEPGSR